MASQIDIRELAAVLKARRGKMGLRTLAEEIGGVSAPTLSRIEQGKVPDLDTYLRICRWLQVPADRFRTEGGGKFGEEAGMETKDVVAAHLRADRELDPETSEALIRMIRLAYDAAARGELDKNK
jgi:transcriptional regulator with XRE-family HTH domain